MALSAVPLVQLSDEATQRMQQNIVGALNQVLALNILSGTLLTKQNLFSSKVNQIPHKLGRSLSGYFVSNLTKNSVVWRSDTSNSSTYLNLSCSANCTVDLWVF